MSAELIVAHPTFRALLLLGDALVGILAVPGLYAVGSRVLQPERPLWPVLIPSLIFAGALARTICDDLTGSFCWKDYEAVARKVLAVTPPGKEVFTEEEIYFLLMRRPPSGMEFGYSHKLTLPPADAYQAPYNLRGDSETAVGCGSFRHGRHLRRRYDQRLRLRQTVLPKGESARLFGFLGLEAACPSG